MLYASTACHVQLMLYYASLSYITLHSAKGGAVDGGSII